MTEPTKEPEDSNEQRELDFKRLNLAMAELDRQFGVGTVFKMGTQSLGPWPAITTGALTLDKAIGIGGLPIGRIVEIYGHESSGKSTICMSVVAEAQSRGGICAYLDTEHAMDPNYATSLGVNMDDLLFSQPDYGEQALDIATTLVKTGGLMVLVIDSVAALVPKAELEGTMEDNQMGLQARMMAKGMRRLVSAANENDTLIIFTNQIREKIGIMFGNPETTPGGRSLKFAASVRIQLRRKEDLKTKDGEIIGVKTVASIPKNKMGPPLRKAEFDIVYAKGINKIGCVLDYAVDRHIVTRKGAWYSYGEHQLGQGRDNTVENLASDMELYRQLKAEVDAL